ncbi:hypothetical protein GCM10028796_05240 [Ramlibacter monticola]
MHVRDAHLRDGSAGRKQPHEQHEGSYMAEVFAKRWHAEAQEVKSIIGVIPALQLMSVNGFGAAVSLAARLPLAITNG